MESYNKQKQEHLDAMMKPAQERLKKYTIEEICSKAGVPFDESSQCFLLESFGKTVHVHYPDFMIEEKLEMWHHLTLLQYLDTADGTALTGQWIGLQQMHGGISRGRGFDKDLETMFKRYFTNATKETFLNACLAIGGEKIEGNADVMVKIPYAPRFPVIVSFWESDDEFPASGKTMLDANGEHYLTIEAAGGACSAVVNAIHEALETNGDEPTGTRPSDNFFA